MVCSTTKGESRELGGDGSFMRWKPGEIAGGKEYRAGEGGESGGDEGRESRNRARGM